MVLRDILLDWLKTHGKDGLCNRVLSCACGIDCLMPCDTIDAECESAKKKIATKDDLTEEGEVKIIEGDEIFIPSNINKIKEASGG